MTITLNIPDAAATALIDNFCAFHGYVAGAETKAVFAKKRIIDFINSSAKQGAVRAAQASAQTTWSDVAVS